MWTVIGDIVTPEGTLAGGAMTVDAQGKIAEIVPSAVSPRHSGDLDFAGFLILPGFLDLHVHGGGGADFMHGTEEAVRLAAKTHARFGTTGLLATTLTASGDAVASAIAAIHQAMEKGRGPHEARVLGIHLEGPYLCAARRGAQPEQFIRPPDPAEFQSWLELAPHAVRQITLAPEIAGAEALTRLARAAGVNVSIGHTDSKAQDVIAAIGWGANQGTHLFNAMRGLHHREPGTAGAILARPEILAEVIADGVHLDPLIVRMIVAAKGPAGVALITDAIEGAAQPDGEYRLGGIPVFVQNGTAAFADGTLAGSVLTMNRAFLNVCRFAELSPAAASRLASRNAAEQLGMAEYLGTLEPGKSADFVILHRETGEVECTVIEGKIAYRR